MQYYILLAVLICGMAGSILSKKLTVPAAITGGLIGMLIFIGAGWAGLIMMTVFFLLGTLSTAWKKATKEQYGIAEAHQGKRKASQVLANAGAAALVAMIGWLIPQYAQYAPMLIACCFSSATADTLSSELGSVYGRQFYNILTFKKDQRGLDGVISAEGTFAGFLGSAIIASIYSLGFGWSSNFVEVLIAGTIGNLTDSFLGATLERKTIIRNDVVNFLNTLAALMTGVIFLALHSLL